MSQHILVTGGAGYVGSHATASLLEEGYGVVVFDNLSTGHQEAVPADAEFIQGDLPIGTPSIGCSALTALMRSCISLPSRWSGSRWHTRFAILATMWPIRST